jgi:mRNA interferase MazF
VKTLAKAGDIVVVDFPGVQGIKRRPAIIISSEVYHQARPDIIVGLVTSQISSARGPTDFVLNDWQASGLHSPSAFRSFLVTLPQSAVTAAIGRASERDWKMILGCVQKAISS